MKGEMMSARMKTCIALGVTLLLPSRATPTTAVSRADSIRTILAPLLVSWRGTDDPQPRSVADAFVKGMPDQLLLRNDAGCLSKSGFSVEAMRGFAATRWFRSPSDSLVKDWACYMGGAGGYCAIIQETDSTAQTVWSAYPMFSVSMPSFDLLELTGDSVPELVLKGMVGISPQMAAEIISWDGKAGRWLTAGDSALVGYRLTYEDTGLGKIKRIVIYDTPIPNRRARPVEK